MDEISIQKLEELKWIRAYLDSLGQAKLLLAEGNFPNNPAVLRELAGLKRTIGEATFHWQALSRSIETTQAQCPHDFVEFHGVGKSYAEAGNVSETVVVAKICRHCKLFRDSSDSTG